MLSEACKAGHAYTPDNTRTLPTGIRQCRECDRLRALAKREKNRVDRPKFKKKHLAEKCFRGHEMAGDNLYWYDSPWGKQRRCRACDRVRDAEKRAAGETVQPTKDFCANGHPMDGDNLGFRSNGYARCRACSLADTKEWQAENRDEYLESRRDARREEKVEADAYFAARIREIYYDPTLDDDALIEALRNVLK